MGGSDLILDDDQGSWASSLVRAEAQKVRADELEQFQEFF